MIFDQVILDALEALKGEFWEGEVWRVVFGARNPLLANTSGARWNPRDTAALYTSLEKDTALAELDHLRSIQTPPTRRSGYTLHRLFVRVDRLLDLRDGEVLTSMGVTDDDLVGDDLTACQSVGGAAEWLGCDGLLVPSARATGVNLVIFVNKQDPDATLEVAESSDIVD